jgi:hypothetical protein
MKSTHPEGLNTYEHGEVDVCCTPNDGKRTILECVLDQWRDSSMRKGTAFPSLRVAQGMWDCPSMLRDMQMEMARARMSNVCNDSPGRSGSHQEQ